MDPDTAAAYTTLTDAVANVIEAEEGEVAGLLTGFVVVTKRRWWDDDGDSRTMYSILSMGGDTPPDEQLGLAEFAGARLRQILTED